MLADWYIPRLSYDTQLGVQKNHFHFCTEVWTHLKKRSWKTWIIQKGKKLKKVNDMKKVFEKKMNKNRDRNNKTKTKLNFNK